MRALLDVNVLVALLDSDHASHPAAMSWFKANAAEGWASCAITQNGCIRIMSNRGYPQPLPVQAIVKRLASACRERFHRFWADEVSILDREVIDVTRMHGPRQLADIYLLALSVHHEGRFVTFDTAIPLAAIKHARPQNLVVL